MDPLTHTLSGVVAARTGLSRGRAHRTWLLALAANVPDVDVAVGWFVGEQSPTFRRMFTHGIVGAPLLALLLAALFKWRRRDESFPALAGLALLGAAMHVLLDLVNSYGVVVLFPFSRQRFELAWVFIIDLAMWALLLAPLPLGRLLRGRVPSTHVYRVFLALLALYVTACALANERAESLLARQVLAEGLEPDLTAVFPEPLGPHRFRGVARHGGSYRSWLFHLIDGRAEDLGSVPTAADDPRVRQVRQQEWPTRLEWFFAAPVWRIRDGKAEVFDLRFQSAVLDRGDTPFVYRFPLPAR